MRFVFKIWQIGLAPVLAVGTQFLNLPSTAQELAIGSHPTSYYSSSVNPALYNAPKNNPDKYIPSGFLYLTPFETLSDIQSISPS